MRQQLVTPRIEVTLVHLGCYLVIVVVYSYHNWAELLITFLSRKLLWLLLALCELVFRKGASRSVQLNCSVQCVWCVFSNRFSLSISGDRSILSLLFKAMRKKNSESLAMEQEGYHIIWEERGSLWPQHSEGWGRKTLRSRPACAIQRSFWDKSDGRENKKEKEAISVLAVYWLINLKFFQLQFAQTWYHPKPGVVGMRLCLTNPEEHQRSW